MTMHGYQIAPLHLTKLDNASLSQLMIESSSAIATFATKERESLYASKNETLKTLLADFQAGLHKSRSSQFAKDLEKADKNRDDALTTLTSLVTAFSRVQQESMAKAYRLLADLFKNYKNVTVATYEKVMENINHLLAQLDKGTYQLALEFLNLTPHLEQLILTQAKFEALYKSRLQEQKGTVRSNSRALRADMIEVYDFLVDFTAINACAYPEKTKYADLRDQLNTIRSRYRKTTSKQKTVESDNLDSKS